MPVSAEEDRRIRAERTSERPVFLESPLGLTVDERKATEMTEADDRPKFGDSGASYLWLCCFINCVVAMTDFGYVIRFVDSWTDSMRGGMVFVGRALTYAKYQGISGFPFKTCLFLVMVLFGCWKPVGFLS